MSNSVNWRRVWEEKSRVSLSDFELDRGTSPRQQEIERLSEEELLNFIEPREFERVLDAGCGTGVNVLRLHSRVRSIMAFDYSTGSVERCRTRARTEDIKNAHLCVASISAIPLPERSVDKVLCLSVFQYMDDQEVRQALREFIRVLTPGGVIVLHVKNLSSLYWLTLRILKRLKVLLGMDTRIEHLRSFRWYVYELTALDCRVLDYNSFNFLAIDGMPKRVLSAIQRFELTHHGEPLFKAPFLRRHGAELKIKARVAGRFAPGSFDLPSVKR